MRAVVYRETGPSSVLQLVECDRPEPGAGEVRVRVVRAGVNPTSIYRRWGGRDNLLLDAAVTRLRATSPIPDTGSLRDVMDRHKDKIAYVTVDTDSVLRDVDTPEDYRQERKLAGLDR